MGKYTDKQNFDIAMKQYPEKDTDYTIGELISIKDGDETIKVGYVAEVIHKPSGEDTYILTDKPLPKNPTPRQLAEVTEVTMLYQGSTMDDPLHDIPTDWIITDGSIAISELTHNPFLFHPNPKKTPQQIDDASNTLNVSMDKYQNAKFRLYGHSLSCTSVQVAVCRCKDPDRILEVNAYNGPNAGPFLTPEERMQGEKLKPKIHIFIDIKDIVGLGYKAWASLGQVHLMDNPRIDAIGQHMGKAYVFDHFGSTLYPNGQLASSYNDFSYIDIDKDSIPDLTIGKDGTLKNIPITLDNGCTFILQSFDLSSKYFSSFHNLLGQDIIDIQLNPELLCTLVSNTISDIEISLAIMSGICNLCIVQNSKIKDDFENRKTQVSESIQEVFRGCDIPLIFENLYNSIKVIMDEYDKHIFNTLAVPSTLLLDQFDKDTKPYITSDYDYTYLPGDYNRRLKHLSDAAAKLEENCSFERDTEASSIFKFQPTIVNSWKVVEKGYNKLLELSEQIFEGDGLRTGREDAIQQSIKDVLDVEETNIKELQNVISNLKTFMTVTTLSFDDKDSSLGNALQAGTNFSVGASVSGVPQSYEAYLSRSEIFDDVKDVIQAFDIQVEKNCKEYSKAVAETYRETLGNFEKGLELWSNMANDFKEKAKYILDSFDRDVNVKIKCSRVYTTSKGDTSITYYYKYEHWGKLINLYNSDVSHCVSEAANKIFPVIPTIEATINSSKTAKDKLGNIEPQLKKIIEDGVYKAFDLMEVVQSQKIVLQLAVKCKLQIRFVIDSINNASMKGRAITTILTKLLQIERLLEYFSTFVSDCFGDNYNEETSSTAPQSSAANFSLNSFT